MFHSDVKLPEGKTPLNPIKPPFSYGFPVVYRRVTETAPPSDGPRGTTGSGLPSLPLLEDLLIRLLLRPQETQAELNLQLKGILVGG